MKKARSNINVVVNIEVTQSTVGYGNDNAISKANVRASGEMTIDEIRAKIRDMMVTAKEEVLNTLVKIDEKDEQEADAKEKE